MSLFGLLKQSNKELGGMMGMQNSYGTIQKKNYKKRRLDKGRSLQGPSPRFGEDSGTPKII